MITLINARSPGPQSNKGDHGLLPALLVHEETQHDSALAEQGQSSSLYTDIKSTLHSNDTK